LGCSTIGWMDGLLGRHICTTINQNMFDKEKCHELKLVLQNCDVIMPIKELLKAKAVSLHVMKAPGGRGGIVLTHSQPRNFMG
jgi:hypothetical protein